MKVKWKKELVTGAFSIFVALIGLIGVLIGMNLPVCKPNLIVTNEDGLLGYEPLYLPSNLDRKYQVSIYSYPNRSRPLDITDQGMRGIEALEDSAKSLASIIDAIYAERDLTNSQKRNRAENQGRKIFKGAIKSKYHSCFTFHIGPMRQI